MLSREKDFTEIDDFQVFPVSMVLCSDFQLNLMILVLTFRKSLCLVLSIITPLTLWSYGNSFIKRASLFGSCNHTQQK